MMLMAVLGLTAQAGTIEFGTLNLENSVQYTDPFDGGDFTVTFAGGANDGKYYTTGSGIRVYGNGTMTIAAKSGIISKIEVTYDGTNKPTDGTVVDGGSYDAETGVWTGSAATVVFTRPSGSGHWRVQKITVTVGEGGEPQTPTFNGWKADGETSVEAGAVYVDNDLMKVSTVYASTLKGSAVTIAGVEFSHYIQVRVDAAPTASNVNGTNKDGSTPIVIAAKKNVDVVFYYRRQAASNDFVSNDGKDMKVVDQADPATALEGTLTVDSKTDDEAYGYVTKAYSLEAGKTYTVWGRGTTISFYAFTFKEGAPSVSYADKTIAEINELTEDMNNVNLKLTNAQVVYVDGKNAYVREGDKAIMFYGSAIDLGFKAGNVLNGAIKVNYDNYYGIHEVKTISGVTTVDGLTITDGDVPQPTPATVADVLGMKHIADYIVLKGVEIVAEGSNIYAQDGDQKVQLYKGLASDDATKALAGNGKKYDIEALFNNIYKNAAEVQPVKMTEVTGDVVGVSSVKASAAVSGAAYNLSGQKVGQGYKGIVVKNGKKVLVK